MKQCLAVAGALLEGQLHLPLLDRGHESSFRANLAASAYAAQPVA
jgi:hypothetical protein